MAFRIWSSVDQLALDQRSPTASRSGDGSWRMDATAIGGQQGLEGMDQPFIGELHAGALGGCEGGPSGDQVAAGLRVRVGSIQPQGLQHAPTSPDSRPPSAQTRHPESDTGLDPDEPHEPLERHPDDGPHAIDPAQGSPSSGRPAQPAARKGARVIAGRSTANEPRAIAGTGDVQPPLHLRQRHRAAAVGPERLPATAFHGRRARSSGRRGGRRCPAPA